MNILGEKLKDLRTEKKLTQRELAQALSVTVPTLSHWECGYQEPSYSDLILISQFFNVSTDYLLGRDELGGIVTPTAPALSAEEQQLLALFGKMTHVQRVKVLAYSEGLLSTSSGSQFPKSQI